MGPNFLQPEIKNALKTYATNLTDSAKSGDLELVVGRDDEIRRIIRILSRKTKNNPALVGEPGVGKTAIIEGLAQRIINGNVPDNLANKEIYQLDLTSLIAGASFQGEFERRLKAVIKEIENLKDKIIVFIDEVHLLIGTGKTQGAMDAANILKPMLARGQLRLIGATTLKEYKQYIEKDSALERRLQKVVIEEPDNNSALTILRGWKTRLEVYHGVKIHDSALVASVNLSSRYITNRFLPDKAIDLIDEACATIKTQINSVPEPLEKLNAQIINLEMEKTTLTSEKDQKSKNRLSKIKDLIKTIKVEQEKLHNRWMVEKGKISTLKDLKHELENKKHIQNQYQINAEYEKAAKILYTEIPSIEKQIIVLQTEMENDNNNLIKEDVTEEEVAKVLEQWTGVSVRKLLESDKNRLIHLKDNLAKNIKGQPEALDKISDAILRSSAGIKDPARPIGSFIFLGPTGVGKTESVKALAYELFNSRTQMVRIDMSEYMEKHSVSRLLGSPPGYVGFEEGGQLTEAVRKKPYSIVLFDEIEKAHSDVLNILLQILDDGFITDSQGIKVNFKNTIIVMTSNIGSNLFLENKKAEGLKLFKHSFRPELINRIDEIIVFNCIDKKISEAITKKLCDDLVDRIAKEKSIYLKFSPRAISKIVDLSFDPQYGARPIKRYIQSDIESAIAKKIINNEIIENERYEISFTNNKINIRKRKLN